MLPLNVLQEPRVWNGGTSRVLVVCASGVLIRSSLHLLLRRRPPHGGARALRQLHVHVARAHHGSRRRLHIWLHE